MPRSVVGLAVTLPVRPARVLGFVLPHSRKGGLDLSVVGWLLAPAFAVPLEPTLNGRVASDRGRRLAHAAEASSRYRPPAATSRASSAATSARSQTGLPSSAASSTSRADARRSTASSSNAARRYTWTMARGSVDRVIGDEGLRRALVPRLGAHARGGCGSAPTILSSRRGGHQQPAADSDRGQLSRAGRFICRTSADAQHGGGILDRDGRAFVGIGQHVTSLVTTARTE